MMKFSIYGRMCLVLGFVFSFSACKDDDDDKSDKTTNQWIESASVVIIYGMKRFLIKRNEILMLIRKIFSTHC